jgi:hypothetical protein
MIRSQIYLTERQRDKLVAMDKTAGKKRVSLFERPSIVNEALLKRLTRNLIYE